MNRNFLFLFFLPFFFSCATIDIEEKIKDVGIGLRGQGADPDQAGSSFVSLEPEVIVVERPVYVPAETPPPSRTPAAGEQAVRASNSDGIVRPQDYSHAAVVYDYDRDWVYEIYAQPLRLCDISLQPGERVVETPFVSDSERWIIGAGVSYENGVHVQHIYIKPQSSGLEASLIINTDRRVYRIILRSFTNMHMPVTRWRYLPALPNNYYPSGPSDEGGSPGSPGGGVDPRFLSFNYRITYSLFHKPYWLPELVFDDGGKTYIQFPNLVLQREIPAVMENRNDVLNYRVIGNMIVIDKLVESITVKIGRTEITIAKKRGGANNGN
jgi:type IV secretion system protein VirB9